MSESPTLDKLVVVGSRFAQAVKEAEELIAQRDRANHDFFAGLTARG